MEPQPYGIPIPDCMDVYPSQFCGIEHHDQKSMRIKPAFSPPRLCWAEIGDEGFWSLSTAKEGNGIHQLRDNNFNTFWQSDGSIPHTITIQFRRLTRISRIDLLVNHKIDESYTPSTVAIRLGDNEQDMHLVKEAVFGPESRTKALGDTWWMIAIHPMDALQIANPVEETEAYKKQIAAIRDIVTEKDFLEAFCVQIAIMNNHNHGKDSHIRQIRIYGPRNQGYIPGLSHQEISTTLLAQTDTLGPDFPSTIRDQRKYTDPRALFL